ncbi:SigE family RNA polymerase sigma factor [Streptomyces sp. NPDC048567]|uniref:SigE family RNA polymerase sigma factor n=1 Tax=unclassified Streptomyces TaxID=2593676 RepID=UPI002E80CABF|nr:SigE family RNA polymerase sigma factor [Streptomyces sp. NBC_00523]WUD00501.1 SigE family RNA polymerase sigma factor [Streptomyces sp. NBC_00523]
MTAGSEEVEAFDAFYAATAKRLVATVYAMTGDLGEAEDAVQEAYVRAWQRWDKVSASGDPLPWVRTVAVRLSISTWRRTRGRLRAHFRHGVPADVPGLTEDRVALMGALEELNRDQRQAVVLHHMLGLPVEEVARETGASNGAVRTRLHRARRILGERLADTPAVTGRRVTRDAAAERNATERKGRVRHG